MAKQYYSVLTTYGAQLFAQAMANKRPVTITHMAVGDGNGKSIQPDSTRTTLFREVHRATISAVSTDPRNNKQVIFELTIPEAVGGFYIREMGIFDATGKMVAMANCPETYKPRLDEGSGKVQVLRMVLLVSSSDAVTITVDDTVIFATRGQLTPKTLTGTSTNAVNETGHTHEITKASTTQAGIVQLTNDTGLDSEVLALTAKAGKAIAQSVAQLQLSTTNALNQKVNKTDISNAVNSTSQTTVASSQAVKTAYDKGVEAKNAANTANNNADGRVSKSGDTMTGHLAIRAGDYSSLRTYNTAGNSVRWEAAPPTSSNMATIVLAGNDESVKYRFLIPKQNGTAAVDGDVVHLDKAEVITGEKTFHHQVKLRSSADYSKLGIIGQNDNDLFVKNGYSNKYLQLKNNGDISYSEKIIHHAGRAYVMTESDNYGGVEVNRAAKNDIMRLEVEDNIFKFVRLNRSNSLQFYNIKMQERTGVLAMLDDIQFGKLLNKPTTLGGYGITDAYTKGRFRNTYYPNHYQGAEVFKMPMNDTGGLMITNMKVYGLNGQVELNLPEAYSGVFILPQATDTGSSRIAYGIEMIGNNKVKIYGAHNYGVNITVLGYANF